MVFWKHFDPNGSEKSFPVVERMGRRGVFSEGWWLVDGGWDGIWLWCEGAGWGDDGGKSCDEDEFEAVHEVFSVGFFSGEMFRDDGKNVILG